MRPLQVLDSGCTLYLGLHDSVGRPSMRVRGKTFRVYRYLYEQANGPVPPGLTIDHLCGNGWCCTLDHLEAVEMIENIRRYRATVIKSECAQGHPWIDGNIYVRKNGRKMCRVCSNERAKIAMKAKRDRERGKARAQAGSPG